LSKNQNGRGSSVYDREGIETFVRPKREEGSRFGTAAGPEGTKTLGEGGPSSVRRPRVARGAVLPSLLDDHRTFPSPSLLFDSFLIRHRWQNVVLLVFVIVL
jgi:hypothetical protein